MTFSLDRARLFRTLSDGRNLQVLSQTDLSCDRYALAIAGEWLGQYQVRCYLVLRSAGHWQVIQIPNQWIADVARLLQPILPAPE
ncbi:MAG TPA: hypothetical protein VFV38_30645 [Ktedonobacteraceae bacterium]|nr:hypothetical protein [Ktedonobacteraceae bacterium]